MAERNLIREGFVFNARAPNGTVSGSQYVSPGQISGLVDEDFLTTTLTVSGGEDTVLDADLGARWKLDRIELYTNETSASNFQMEISENNFDYRTVVMTGSTGLWVGDIDTGTVLGAPRYIRYSHNPSIDTDVYEWRAINDEDLLDFGSTGTQTALSIGDSPIGTTSTIVESLLIKNNFSKSAEGFVFIDNTGNVADDEIEISLSSSGPWFSRNSAGINQPSLVAWDVGSFNNTRIVPSGLLTISFGDGDAKGWAMEGATQTIVDGKLRGATTSTTPIVYNSSEFVALTNEINFLTSVGTNVNKFALRAADADTVKVVAQTSSVIPSSDFVEGPRLFWKTEENVEASAEIFRTELSTLSTLGNSPLTSKPKEYTFEVSSVPTWSGTIRGLAFQPFTTVTGTGHLFDFQSIEIFSSAGERIGLSTKPVHGSDFAYESNGLDSSLEDNVFMVISNKHTIQADCIITKIGVLMSDSTNPQREGMCLVRELPGSTFPNPGTNFDVPYAASFRADLADTNGTVHEAHVFWQALAGDRIAALTQVADGVRYIAGDTGASYGSPTVSGFNALSSLTNFETALNSNLFFLQDREYLIFYEAVSPEILGYQSTGTYRTPVFDVGLTPTLAMLDYETVTPSDSSVDSLGQVGFDSVRARANDQPPFTNLALGEVSNDTFSGLVNSTEVYAGNAASPYQINLPNTVIEKTTGGDLLNVAVAPLFNDSTGELWLLNGVVSGTNPFQTTDVSLLWDVIDPDTKLWLRTDHVKGALPYGYDANVVGGDTASQGFTGLGFMADYTRGEIYIVQRVPAFTLGAGSYYGLVMDLSGNFKDLFFRDEAMNITGTDLTFFRRARAMAYAENLRDLTVVDEAINGVFFVVHDTTGVSSFEDYIIGTAISAFRNGDSIGIRNISLVNTTNFSAIPGLGFTVSSDFGVKGIAYNTRDGKLYLHFDNLTGSGDDENNRKPEFVAMDVVFNETTSQFEYSASPTSTSAFDTAPFERGFSKRRATSVNLKDDDISDMIRVQGHDYTMNVAYSSTRDSFYILRSLMGDFTADFPGVQITSSIHFYLDHAVSFIYECGAGTVETRSIPGFPSQADLLWGTASGTLEFEDIASDGVNFPTGRYVQVEYQLNSSSDQLESPSVTSSNIAQGLRIGQIPAGGTKEIFVRTNIPEGRPVALQQGRLKVYWESLE